MKMDGTTKMKFLFIISLMVLCFSCSSSTESDPAGACETVINAHGPGFLKVINRLNQHIEVFLPEYALAANVRPRVCEIYGLAVGKRSIELSLCADNNCSTYSNTKNLTVTIEDGKTHTIEVTDSFFDN